MNKHEKINYLEFASRDLAATKVFFTSVFGWRFTDYGPEYTAFDHQGLEGGFYRAEKVSSATEGAPLTVFFSSDLKATLDKLVAAGVIINKPIFDFPGGRRFHFLEPGGNEFAVWGEPNS